MREITQIIQQLIKRREQGLAPMTLLAVCPNSSAVLEAAVYAAAKKRSVMLLAATLNQVDFEGSYTGWTPSEFVQAMQDYAKKYHWQGPIYPCLDHGGPWLKDLHNLANLSFTQTMEKVKSSISHCVQAGYRLLHIDPTVDRSLTQGQQLPLELVVQRTVELITHAEQECTIRGLTSPSYEVGTEEVHGGMVDLQRFETFIELLKIELKKNDMQRCWPCLLVAQVGTDLHTSIFNPEAAQRLYQVVSRQGSLIKGHYTDWVARPGEYPASGMGAANVGPEFTAEEFDALGDLEKQEERLIKGEVKSQFMRTLKKAVIDSGRWKKWLLDDERGLDFDGLHQQRQEWLLKTGSRYIWTDAQVMKARVILYQNLECKGIDAHGRIIERISLVIEKYLQAFNLVDSVDILGE